MHNISEIGDILSKISSESIKETGSFIIALPGGSAGKLVPDLLKIIDDLGSVYVTFVDERCVPLDSPDSNGGAMLEKLCHIGIPRANILTIEENESAVLLADDYQTRLESLFEKLGKKECDFTLLGVGPDGHIASLFPDHELLRGHTSAVWPIIDSPKLPKERITFSLTLINNSKNIMVVMTGESKLPVVLHTLSERGIIEKEKVLNDFTGHELPIDLVKPAEGEVEWCFDDSILSAIAAL
eukprot:TRINITY_DN781921_c0_g1_i1.p1 TRINITY_DN781921_c0_g1~~TRINITY_DN781921_c0_g1_i1.p1  ORF type:complete len:241 (+),score=62.31 TRINITY_DN781921_c0_g1_i1:65-787(+)